MLLVMQLGDPWTGARESGLQQIEYTGQAGCGAANFISM